MKFIKWLNRIIILLMLIIAVLSFINFIRIEYYERILVTVATIPVIILPWIIKKFLHYDMSEPIKLVYYIFALMGLTLGSILNFYNKISWFDLFTHFVSGILSSVAALIILKKRNILKDKCLWFNVVFIICFTLSIAVLWEFFEFSCDLITGGDTQKVLESGVDDTMTDMLIAFFGTILFNLYFVWSCIHTNKFVKKIEKYF